MTLKQAIPRRSVNRARRGFTLAELLAAMAFIAVVVPVALEGMRVATMAGEVGQRRLVAVRIANKVLNDLKVEHSLVGAGQRGQVEESGVSYSWTERSENWTEDSLSRMMVATVTVDFRAQGRACSVQVSTLVPES